MISIGFQQSKNDYSLFTKSEESSFIAALVYVDGILLTGDSLQLIEGTKAALHYKFTVKDLGIAKYFLAIELHTVAHSILLNQRKYIADIFHYTSLNHAVPVKVPLPTGLKLSHATGTLLSSPNSYRRIVGQLLYFSITRPDISYSVHHLSQFVQPPTSAQYQIDVHILKYLKSSINFSLFYPYQSKLTLTGFFRC